MTSKRALSALFVALATVGCVGVSQPTSDAKTPAILPPISLVPTAPASSTTTPSPIATPAPIATATAATVATAPTAATAPTLAPTFTLVPTPTPGPTDMPPATPPAELTPSASPLSPVARPKAVFIVGPEEALTPGNLEEAETMAVQAEAAGMDVRRVFHPYATWENVLDEIQGASLVAYLGHGYGYPSNSNELNEKSQDGMGLNTVDAGADDDVTYHGATALRQSVRLAPHAVVILLHGCYTAGNGELGTPIPTVDVARERVDNYASGWLAVGAGAVFGYQWGTRWNFSDALVNSESTIDLLFTEQHEHIGWNDLYFDSVRTLGAASHLDPEPADGYLRAVTGDLAMTTAEWRSGAGQLAPAASLTP
jgi:hypothetical protein